MAKNTKPTDAPDASKPAAPAKKKRKFGFADVVIIISVLCLAFVGWTWYYGANIAPAQGASMDKKACIAFNDGLAKSHKAFTSNDNKGYIDEFFKGNDAALNAADPNGSLTELLTQVGMQRLSINYDMDAVTLMNYIEPLAQRVQGEDYCATILGVTIQAPSASPSASN
jgi:hypothetical protein